MPIDPFFGAIASGLLSGGSSLLGGMFGASGQAQTNAQQMAFQDDQRYKAQLYNTAEAQKNRDWQETMSNTAYQRAMSDMRLAGLNPILAYQQGGASSGPGAAGSITGGGTSLGNPGASLQAGITSAGEAAGKAAQTKAVLTQAEKDQSQVDLNKATEDMNKATTDYQKANEGLSREMTIKATQDTATSASQMRQADENAKYLRAGTANLGIDNVIKSHEANTAFHKSRQAMYEADQWQKSGPGVLGQTSGTIEKGLTRLWNSFRTGEMTSPTDPRFWGFKGRPGAPPATAGTPMEITIDKPTRR